MRNSVTLSRARVARVGEMKEATAMPAVAYKYKSRWNHPEAFHYHQFSLNTSTV